MLFKRRRKFPEVVYMLKAMEVAKYFFSKDPNRQIFNLKLIQRNNRSFYEGNAKINKFLHMAQNIYVAKNGVPLFDDALYAYDNGAVVDDVLNMYAILYNKEIVAPKLDGDINDFLDRIFYLLRDADIDELIQMSHEDDEWIEKSRNHKKNEQKMDSLSRIDEYKKQYADALWVMDRMVVSGYA